MELSKYSGLLVTEKVVRKFMEFVLEWRGFVYRVIDDKNGEVIYTKSKHLVWKYIIIWNG